jgi:DNA-directed RNA polymerase specialized sigma24 family protein
MIAGTPTGTVAAVKTWLRSGRELWWLPRSRVSNGEAIRDRAALIEEQIPGLWRFACALLRGNREAADGLVQDTLVRALAHWNLRRKQGNLGGWLYTSSSRTRKT